MSAALVIQTAFAGDLILTLPMIQELHRLAPKQPVDVLCIPATAGLLRNHPAIRTIHIVDKRAGKPPLATLIRTLRRERYALCLSPHRSLRSALIARGSGAARRIAFATSAGGPLFTDRVPYQSAAHEVTRNLSLLNAITDGVIPGTPAVLYPAEEDYAAAKDALGESRDAPLLCVAPGSVWATKRWSPEGFARMMHLLPAGYHVALLGGKDDEALCEDIVRRSSRHHVSNLAGRLNWLESAALIGEAVAVVSNDSAPVHIASAMGTPVLEIFCATVPDFGFTPWQVPYRLRQVEGLDCKPCGIHGGNTCPTGTLECSLNLTPEVVLDALLDLLGEVEAGGE